MQSAEVARSALDATTGSPRPDEQQLARLKRGSTPKWRWLDSEQVQQIRDLAAEEVSQRAISRMTGISRDTVRKILRGCEPHEEVAFHRCIEIEVPPFSGQPQRCAGCGGMVLMPCLACFLRARSEEVKS